jgi:2-dehydro-3-deoxyphosphogluconate aldolase/(4S)-4-hydroxy-2-oxoglutarate aldolase
MRRWEIMAAIAASKVIGIVRTDTAEEAAAGARALLEGGLTVVEASMTTPGALDLLRDLARDDAGAVLGMGTVLDAETARLAILAGARFLVSPSADPQVAATAHRYGAAYLPGALTPTEIVTAMSDGADAVKLFPASATTPASMRAILAALPQAPLIPTGGVRAADAADWLAAGAVAVGVGGSLAAEGPAAVRALLQAVRPAP